METIVNGIKFKAERYGYLYVNSGNGYEQAFEPRKGDGAAAAITILDERDFMRKCRKVAKRWS